MIITQTTMVSFTKPEEKKDAARFEAEHPDWDKFMTAVSVVYTKTENVSAKWGLIDDT